MNEKKPWLGGLLNLLVPGLGRFYAGDKLGGCASMIMFPLGLAVLAFATPLLVSLLVEATGGNPGVITESTMQGVAGLVIFLLWLAMFPSGYFFVKRYNHRLAASTPEIKKPTEPEQPEAKLKKLQEMLGAGLITPEDYATKKADILSKM